MSSPKLETFLARLYSDEVLREQFLLSPGTVAATAGLDEHDVASMERIDRAGLLMAAESFDRKRAAYGRRSRPALDILRRWASRLRSRK